jgi:hypothetical protein
MSIDLDRITHPLRLAAGSHDPGSGKGCAMNVISYINGDTVITDYPECSARPLARMVQDLNDRLADESGFLSPENSVIVLDLGWQTVGTAGAPREVVWQWLADLLVDPEMGVVKYAAPDGAEAFRGGAALCVREAGGECVSVAEWNEVRAAANAYAANAYAANAANAASAYAAYAAANAASAYAAYAANAAYAASAYAAYAASAYAASAASAYAASAASAYVTNAYEFTAWAIQRWRDIAGLDSPENVAAESVDYALSRIG